MLSYNQQYDIANGIFITYNSELDYRLLHSKHGKQVRDKTKNNFPYHKYESRKRETFILACIYIMFNKNPSSFMGMLSELRELDLKEVSKFRHDIMYYQNFIKHDIEYLVQKYGGNTQTQAIIKEYTDGKIKFYTLWFYFTFNPKESIEDLASSRVFKYVYKKLKFIMMFLTFSDDAINNMKLLFEGIEL